MDESSWTHFGDDQLAPDKTARQRLENHQIENESLLQMKGKTMMMMMMALFLLRRDSVFSQVEPEPYDP